MTGFIVLLVNESGQPFSVEGILTEDAAIQKAKVRPQNTRAFVLAAQEVTTRWPHE